jgi:hypothetical protein
MPTGKQTVATGYWVSLGAHLYVKQFRNVEKKALQGRSCTSTHLPMASASAVVVATTSDVEGLTNTR